jgi:hypothetical protein
MFFHPVASAFGPSLGQCERIYGVVPFAGVGWALVQNHADVASDGALNFESGLGIEFKRAAVDVALKANSVLGDFAKLGERKDLVASGICKNRAIPPHEIVKPTKFIEYISAGAEVEVVGVAEDDSAIESGVGEFCGVN